MQSVRCLQILCGLGRVPAPPGPESAAPALPRVHAPSPGAQARPRSRPARTPPTPARWGCTVLPDMDVLPMCSIFQELQIVHETGYFSALPSLEEYWQQVKRTLVCQVPAHRGGSACTLDRMVCGWRCISFSFLFFLMVWVKIFLIEMALKRMSFARGGERHFKGASASVERRCHLRGRSRASAPLSGAPELHPPEGSPSSAVQARPEPLAEVCRLYQL